MKFAYYNHVLVGGIVAMLAFATYWLFIRDTRRSADDYPTAPTVCAMCGHAWQMDRAQGRRQTFDARHRGDSSSTSAGGATPLVPAGSVASQTDAVTCPSCGQPLIKFESVFCPDTQRRFVIAEGPTPAGPRNEEQIRKLSPFIDHPKSP